MEKRRIVIVGGNIAGFCAAMSACKTCEQAEITILSEENCSPYRRSMLSSIVASGSASPEGIFMFSGTPSSLRASFLRGMKATFVDPDKKVVQATEVRTQKKSLFEYDSLVLTTGGSSPILPIEGVTKKGVFSLRTLKDASQILGRIHSRNCRAVVVGAGFAGLEVAEALAKQGVRVIIVVRSRILREFIEPDLSSYLVAQIERKGVRVVTGLSPKRIEGRNRIHCVRMEDNTKIPASIVVFATGVNPNVELAKELRIRMGDSGAIGVNKYMQTSIPEIYAAGDCAETLDALTDKWTYYPVGSVAAKGGAVAGVNSSGHTMEFNGLIRAQMDMIFGEGIASIGHGSESARKMGIKVDLVDLALMKGQPSFLRYCPAKIRVAIDTHERIVGTQIVSKRFASQYAFDLFSAIQKRMTLGDFLEDWHASLAAFIPMSKK